MRYNILIGGKAGQGINKISEIISKVMGKQGYYIFNYREYPSLIRGGHNFNILSINNNPVNSTKSKIDTLIALDEKTIELHKSELKNSNEIFSAEKFKELGKDANIALASAYLKSIGVSKYAILEEIKKEFKHESAFQAFEKGYESRQENPGYKPLKNKIIINTGSKAVAQGAINSKIDLFIAYPMTPATGLMHELASNQIKNNLMVFQPENEIAVVNAALGASFTGTRTMIGTSGGGYDLMTEGLSFQGISEIPLVCYLASRPGPGTGVPTYSLQNDLDIALRGGHGEFPRIVIAPGDPTECIEKTNEAFYLSEKFNALSIILSDKHLAESEFSTNKEPKKPLKIIKNRKVPGKSIVKASSYEHDKFGNTTESAELTKLNAEARLKKYEEIKKECKKFEMIKIHSPKAKNLIIAWGSTKGAILDAIENLDYKFLQVLYLKPLSNQIKIEIEKTQKAGGKIILIEQNLTGQLGRLIREKTGFKINKRILKYDSKPFNSDELKEEILRIK